ncbi:hypothetical protein U0070_005301 [Myodes glareolus]|uniref:Uncharacterized protein n=1 Tax=Myodes glareolus TaxID=447135 RepID=A0AAW0I3G3_MYOGA
MLQHLSQAPRRTASKVVSYMKADSGIYSLSQGERLGARAHKCRAVHTALPLKINLPSTSLPAKLPGRLERDYTAWL